MLTKLENNKPVDYIIDESKRIILCGVPGAFTPGCTSRHLPGFIGGLEELKNKGIDKVVFVATNDAYVMDAWNTHHGHPDIDCVSDMFGNYCESIGELSKDHSFGMRCNRFAVLIEDGKIVRKFENPFIEGVLGEL
jgi:peroxiredoxin